MWIDDDILERCEEPVALSCWIPERSVVVLGSSNRASAEVRVEQCEADNVAILKRYGGGGTVLLHGGCVVVSLGAWVRQPFQNRYYFELVNQAVISCLKAAWPSLEGLAQDGMSDITFKDRKVAGTSLFRSRNYLLYQASILVETRLSEIDRYLCHPSKEPEYRRGRPHSDFLVGLQDLDAAILPERCLATLRADLIEHLRVGLAGELWPPQESQFASLLARAQRGRLESATLRDLG